MQRCSADVGVGGEDSGTDLEVEDGGDVFAIKSGSRPEGGWVCIDILLSAAIPSNQLLWAREGIVEHSCKCIWLSVGGYTRLRLATEYMVGRLAPARFVAVTATLGCPDGSGPVIVQLSAAVVHELPPTRLAV